MRLTGREKQILGLLLQGHGIRSTAELLGIAEQTVKNHRRIIFAKLGVERSRQLMPRYNELQQIIST